MKKVSVYKKDTGERVCRLDGMILPVSSVKQYSKLVSVYRRGLMDRDTFISAVSML